MGEPVRIQRKRARGWKMPENTIYVGRPGMFGNYAALRMGLPRTGRSAANAFRVWVETEASDEWKDHAAKTLRGKNLACWCLLSSPCHADVLLELANAPLPRSARGVG